MSTTQNQLPATPAPKKRGRRLLRWLGGIVAGLVILSLLGAVFESLSEAADARRYPPPGQMIDVGGYRLHIHCVGAGSPTVVIDAGLGGWSTSWEPVQAEVARTTRVCTYDRAGMGWSDPGLLPRDVRQYADELHILLQKAGVAGPFVLVGHSMGGLTVRVFAAAYPEEVAGVVLIDSMFPGQGGAISADALPRQTQPAHAVTPLPLLGRFGVVRVLGRLIGAVSANSPDALGVSPENLQAWMDESKGISDSMLQAQAVKSFGDIPLIVLTAVLGQSPGWDAGQAELLKLSTRSQQLFAEESGHNIEMDQPEAAVGAIVQMVQIIRDRQGSDRQGRMTE